MKKFSSLLLILLAGVSGYYVLAQCNSFNKKTCMPELKEYTHNGQYNSTVLSPGETAELEMNLFSDNDYRIVVCGQEVLGDLMYKITDESGKVIFDNKDHQMTKMWDFSVQSTQKLTIEVTVPQGKKSANELTVSGCASVLVGFKEKKK